MPMLIVLGFSALAGGLSFLVRPLEDKRGLIRSSSIVEDMEDDLIGGPPSGTGNNAVEMKDGVGVQNK